MGAGLFPLLFPLNDNKIGGIKMAKRKSSKKGRKTTKKTASNVDLAVVALIVISILLGVLIYAKSGVIGVKLNEILGGMME